MGEAENRDQERRHVKEGRSRPVGLYGHHRCPVAVELDVLGPRLFVALCERLDRRRLEERGQRQTAAGQALIAANIWIARRLWPPRSKKSSWMPMSLCPSRSAQMRASSASIGVFGPRWDGARAADATTGGGSRLRAIFLLGVSGKESRAM